MNSENGWILPDGRYVECEYTKHIQCAEEVLKTEEEKLEKIAIKVSCLPRILQKTVLLGIEYKPHFMTVRKRFTKKQMATIEEYCLYFRYRPPLDYFIQQDLHGMCELSTEAILAILKKE